MMHGHVTAIALYSFDFTWSDAYRIVSFKLAAHVPGADDGDAVAHPVVGPFPPPAASTQ